MFFKLNHIRTHLICSKIAYSCCFSKGGNLDFLDLLQKKFKTLTTSIVYLLNDVISEAVNFSGAPGLPGCIGFRWTSEIGLTLEFEGDDAWLARVQPAAGLATWTRR